jgi:hypothetical protein
MARQTVADWLDSFTATALAYDLEGHMAHIASDVMVFGVPGFDVLDYDDWFRQCAHEFPQKLIRSLSYSAPLIRTATADRILFKTLEATGTADGGKLVQAVEMLIEKRQGRWLLKQLRMVSEDEARSDGLL